jgi:hypothetical protein
MGDRLLLDLNGLPRRVAWTTAFGQHRTVAVTFHFGLAPQLFGWHDDVLVLAGKELKTVALGATISYGDNVTGRTFKTAWFAKAARKAHITDQELCEAIKEVMLGQADDLGGGVFKKRINNNMHRSILLAKGGRYWIYQYVLAKSDRENIDDDELVEFRKLAKVYEKLSADKVKELMGDGELTEICNDNKAKV